MSTIENKRTQGSKQMSKQISPIATIRNDVQAMAPEFSKVLPRNIRVDSFIRVVLTAVQNNPDLIQADKKSFMAAALKCATDGLIPDGRQAAFVTFKDTKNSTVIANYMPMFSGILKRVMNSKQVLKVETFIIHENDYFVWNQGSEPSIEHKPLFPGDRGSVIGAYAIATLSNNEKQFEVMSYQEIEAVRRVSRTSKFGPWEKWWGEMARKTVFKRLAKWLPLDADAFDLIDYDNQVTTEPGHILNINEKPSYQEVKKSKLDIISEPKKEEKDEKMDEKQPKNEEKSDVEEGEIIDKQQDEDDF